MYPTLTLLAYIIDKILGEFHYIKHPVVVMGEYIKWYEKYFYGDNIYRGVGLTISLIALVYTTTHISLYLLHLIDNQITTTIILATIASTTIASNMLYSSVKDIIKNPQNIKFLVSRDTQNLSQSDTNRASIETYAENLSDGVIAPLLYLLFFGIEGAFLYKAINTLDSMVGYRNKRYEKFGKASALLDDIANYIPSRITAILISILMCNKEALRGFYRYGKRDDSPNAGHPISAMALSLGVRLGGDSYYFGRLKHKPEFGDGKKEITTDDILKALSIKNRLDILIIITLGVTICITYI
jgi:adenosylcobinamide-phosphate synthase